MLRTIFVIILIVIGLRYSMKGAFYVLLFYLWIAYFRPDAWIYSDWVTRLNLSFIVGAAAVLAMVFSKERFRFGLAQTLMVAFLVHSFVSTLNSEALLEGHNLWLPWTDFARKVTIGVVIVTLVTTEERLRMVLVVIAASLAFEQAKQGWAQLFINPGGTNTNPSPFMGDNNGVAVGMLMLVPVLTALAATAKWRVEKYVANFLTIGIIYRAISTYSRGGFLAAMALGTHYLLRTKNKVRSLIAVGVVVAIIYPVLPAEFWQRMGTIPTSTAETADATQLDVSGRGRLHFWEVAVVMANDRPILGVGFDAYNFVYDRYDFSNGAFGVNRAVHSAWFGMLAEVGYVGLSLFLLLIVRAFYVNWRARRQAKKRPDLASLLIYGTALETALVVFAVGGSFVPHQYNEMLWHFLALTIVMDRLVTERLATPAPVLNTDAIPLPSRTVVSGISGLPRTLPTPRSLR